MDNQQMTKQFAAGRIAIGTLLFLFPGRVFKGTLGEVSDSKGLRAVARMLGARDIVLGVGPLVAAQRGEPVRPWITYGAASDAADALAILLAWRHLRPWHRFLVLVTAMGGAGGGVYLASQSDR